MKNPLVEQHGGKVACAPGRIRTADAGLRTAALYPLSYGGADPIVAPG